MARKSRHTVETTKPKYKIWKIGIYIRLSKEDSRHFDESESVSNQRIIIRDHIDAFNDGDEYIIIDEYVDDGISGTTDDERDDFQRMLSDIKRGRINCVIVKDLARSFRNYSDQGYYLDDWFPRHNVRFISLYHQALDSYKDPKMMRSIAVPIQGVLNENHCAETSEKIREVFDMKRRNGQHIGSFAAYGWIKDPNNKNALVIDEEAAAVINDMADMLLSGMSLTGIAVYLNDHGVLCPCQYKKEKLGVKYANPFAREKSLWCATTVRRILKDRMICGDLVQGRYRIISYKVHVQEHVPEDEWYIVENAIPAIIDREKFEKIQSVLKRDTRTSPGEHKVYLFSGFLRCGDCGHSMCRSKSGNNVYYYCKTYKEQSKLACTKHTIRHDKLYTAVLAAVQQQIYLAINYAELIESINKAPARNSQATKLADSIQKKEKELEKISRYRQELYKDWKDGEISQSDYRSMRAEFDEQSKQLEELIEKLRVEQAELEIGVDTENPYIKAFKEYQNIETLSRELLIELVDRIIIYEGGKIEIIFNFPDEMRRVQEFIEENTAAETAF